MKLVDLYPLKGYFKPGETVELCAQIETCQPGEVGLQVTIWHLAEELDSFFQTVSLGTGMQEVRLAWQPPREAPRGMSRDVFPRGYGIQCELRDSDGRLLGTSGSAFDVLEDWTAFPRYGFLSDFQPGRRDADATLDALVRYHINGLQFYDWQYRHDCLVPPTTEYIDPLGRQLSLDTVRELIAAAHRHGMAAMPYLAVYAASLDFWRQHPDWALYDPEGNPITFFDFLGIMDPSPDRPWIHHLLNECERVLTQLPFDGLHVDQYGEPQAGQRASGEPVDIPGSFRCFIDTLKQAHPGSPVVFNAVKNWPIESLAFSAQDFCYIEVWPPKTSYLDLPEIILNARRLSGNKPVVIALYLPADRPANNRLADALIASCGGSRIEIGENTRLLSDPYFPKHEAIPAEFERWLRRYKDFSVRYGELLGPGARHLPDWPVEALPGIWTIVRSNGSWLTVNLVNLTGIDGFGWDEAHNDSVVAKNFQVVLKSPPSTFQVWWASPDNESLQLQPVSWHISENRLILSIPVLNYWGIIVIERADEEFS